MSGGRVAGIVSVALSVVAGVRGIVYYTTRHPTRGLVLVIACGALLVLGVVLIILGHGSSKATPGT
jgi:hypothetical protein